MLPATLSFLLRRCLGLALLLSAAAPAAAQVPQPLAWVPAAPTAVGRSESEGLGLGNKLYVLGGFYTNNLDAAVSAEVYDAASNTWAPLADLPEPITHAGTAEDGANLYIAGGYVGRHPGPITDRVWRYHIASNTWHAFVPLPTASGAGMVQRLGRELHYFGGAVRVNGVVQRDAAEHWALDLDAANPAWSSRAPLPIATNHLGGAVLNGKLYAIGGQLLGDEDFGNQATMFEYDPAADAWTARANLPRALGHTTNSVCTLNNRLVVVGGRHNGPAIAANIIEYNPGTNTWRELTPLPTPLLAPVAGIAGGRLVVNGGYDAQLGYVATTWRSGAVLGARRAPANGALQLWPNPLAGAGRELSFDTPLAGECRVEVADALGRLLQAGTLRKPRGTARYPLAAVLRPGLYTVTVSQAAYRAVQKLVVE